MSATSDGIRVTSVYAPNGRTPDSELYHYESRRRVAAGLGSLRAK